MRRFLQIILIAAIIFSGGILKAQPGVDFAFAEGSDQTNISQEAGTKVATDADGNFFVTGSFGGSAFNLSVTAVGNLDIFLAKYDPNGNLLWVTTVGSPNLETAGDVDYRVASDRVYIIGTVRGNTSSQVEVTSGWLGTPTTSFTSVVDNTGFDIYIGVFDGSDGSLVSNQVYGGSNNDAGYGITVDESSGDYYSVGTFRGNSVDFGSGFLLSTDGSFVDNGFILKLSSGFSTQWAYGLTSTGNVSPRGIDDYNGFRIGVTGSYENQVIYRNVGVNVVSDLSLGSKDIFVVVYNPDGSLSDNIEEGGSGDDAGIACGYQQAGDLHVTGYFKSPSMDFGTQVISSNGGEDIFLARYVGDQWFQLKTAGSTLDDRAIDIAISSQGDPIIVGYIGGDITFGASNPISITGVSSRDAFIAKYEQFGYDPMFAIKAGGSQSDRVNGIAITFNRAFVTGNFNSIDASFGSIGIASSSGTTEDDIFIAGLTGTGNFTPNKSSFDQSYSGTRAAWGDIDQDGDLDLAYTGFDPVNGYETKMYTYNQGTGQFDLFTTKAGTSDGNLEFIDIDQDGNLDMHPFGFGGTESPIYLNNGGLFTATDYNIASLGNGSMDWADYDKDGDLDLAVAGQFSSVKGAAIYKNDNGILTDIGAATPAADFSGIKWADLDGTGQLELMIFGDDAVGTQFFRIAQEDINGNYFDLGTTLNFTTQSYGDIAVADYDADGDNDFAIVGNNFSGIPTTFIYRNDGWPAFTSISFSLTGLRGGAVDWGDYDNDGDMDLLVSGEDDILELVTVILRNDGSDLFTELDYEFTGLIDGDAQFGDYDNDGDLDILLVGTDDQGFDQVEVWENFQLGQNFEPAQMVAGSSSVVDQDVTLTWSLGVDIDDKTPDNGVTYNLAVSKSPGGTDYVVSPMALAAGTNLVAKEGNMGKRTSITLNIQESGTYYWRVQAVDGSYKGGVWSTEQTFTVTGNDEVAYYPLNGNTLDFSSSDFHGTANGAVTTSDRFGNSDAAYLFDGINDFISVPDNDILDFNTTNFTLSAWVKTSNTTDLQRIISKGSFTGSSGYMIRTTGDGRAFFEINGNALVTSNTVIADGNWHMVSAVLDRDNSAKIFIDGALDNETIINTTSFTLANATDLTFGIHGTSNEPLDGSLDEIHAFSYALTDQEIFTLHAQESGLEHWFLEDGNPDDIISGLIATTQNGVITTTPDRFGNPDAALFFDGGSNYAYSSNSVVGGSQRFSISAWVYPNTNGFVGTLISENDIGGQQVFYLDLGSSQDAVFVSFTDGNNAETTGTPGGEVKGFKWNHVVVNFDNGNVEIYVNNELAATGTHTIVFDGTSTLKIGAGSLINANLDDIRIYRYPLSTEIISELYFENGWTGVSPEFLAGYYDFSGDAVDESGNGNDGVINGAPNFTTDRFGNPNAAIEFDGINDYVRVDHGGSMGTTADFTVNAWVKFDEQQSGFAYILWDNGFSYGITSQNYEGLLEQLAFHYNQDNFTFPTLVSDPNYVPFDVWTMLTVRSFNGGEGIEFFINGEFFNNSFDVSGRVKSIGDNIQIGGRDELSNDYFKGAIDDVSIYTNYIDNDDIKLLYEAGGYTGPKDLIAHWPVDSLLGFSDVAGAANDLSDEGSSPDYAADRFKVANATMNFDGTQSQYVVTYDLNHPQGDLVDFSYSFWEYHTTTGPMTLLDIGDESQVLLDADNDGVRYFSNASFPGVIDTDGTSTALKDRWNHILVSGERIGNDGFIKIYVNGVLTADAQYYWVFSGNDIFLGLRQDSNSPFTGRLDDIRIYNYALDVSEVLELFNENVNTEVPIAWLEPALAAPDDEVTIYYNAERGNKALMGADRVYIHTGAVVGNDPVYQWGNYVLDTTWFSGTKDNGIGEMFNAGGNTWGYTLSPSSRDALGVPSEELMQRLGMIFRSPDAALIGQGTPSEYGDFPGGRVEDGTYWTPGDIYLDLLNPTPGQFDSLALVALYQATNGDFWNNNANWLAGPIDTWYGVTVTDGRISDVSLDSNNLDGTLPSDLGQLNACLFFSLTDNNLSGAIPVEIGNMSALEELYLDLNGLTGNIPTELGDLSNLFVLDLSENQLDGSIPSSFGSLSNLEELILFDNILSGNIPVELQNLTNLLVLNLANANNLTGSIPAELGNLSLLTELYLSGNNLSGEIPSELGNLFNLQLLELSSNLLTGAVPASLGSLSSLTYLNVSINQLEDMADLTGLTALDGLYLEFNKFSMEDLLLNNGVASTFYEYAPQNLIGEPETRFVSDGTFYSFDLGFDTNVTGSSYDWYFEGGYYTTTNSSFLDFDPITFSESGSWEVFINNSSLPLLTLQTESIILNVISLCSSQALDPSDTRIDRFVFGDLDNTSDPSSCATYTNFTNLAATIYPGQTIEFGFSLGTCGIETNKAFAVFIDFDGSGDFSTLERVGESEVISGTGFISLTVPIDPLVPLGTFLMRVVAVETSDPSSISGCGDYAKGETEDYTVNVVESTFDLAVIADDIQPLTYFNSNTPATSGIDVLNISATVSNSEIGDVTNLTGGLELFLSTDQFFDASDISAGAVDINVPGGTSEVFTDVSFTIPGAATTGSYYLILSVDPNDAVGETNENNNTAISSNPIYVLTGDSSPPAVTLQNPPPSYEIGTGGVMVTANISDDSGIQNVFLAYGKISEITDDSNQLQYNIIIPEEISQGVFQHTLNDTDFDDVGVQYFFGATDNAGNFNNSLPFPATISTEFTAGSIQLTDPRPVNNSEEPQDTDYRIFSVPVRGATIQSIFGFSSTDRKQWRVWQYSNGNSELTSTGSSLDAGKGYWLIYKNSAGINLNFGGVAVDASNSNPFIMNLSVGYNLVGNPYKFPISWQQVIDHNIGKGIINDQNVSGLTFFREGFENQGNSTLGVTEGAFVLSNLSVGLEIPFSAQTARFGNNFRTSRNSLDKDNWDVGINLSNDKTFYNVASVGMNPHAETGMDNLDHQAVPYLFNYLEFNSRNELLEDRISRDIVKTTADHVWEFEATTSYDPSDAVLSWDNTYFGDNDQQLYIYDGSEERVVNMREQQEYHFFLNGKRNFKILYGSAEFITSELQPERMTLGHAYPNPFADATRIPFTLSSESESYKVRMTIYNSVGELVNVLTDDEFNSGFYAVDWDGTNTLGQKVSEGIYIYKLTITDLKGSKDLTGKLIYGY